MVVCRGGFGLFQRYYFKTLLVSALWKNAARQKHTGTDLALLPENTRHLNFHNPMVTLILVIAGILCFALFFGSIRFFEKI